MFAYIVDVDLHGYIINNLIEYNNIHDDYFIVPLRIVLVEKNNLSFLSKMNNLKCSIQLSKCIQPLLTEQLLNIPLQ